MGKIHSSLNFFPTFYILCEIVEVREFYNLTENVECWKKFRLLWICATNENCILMYIILKNPIFLNYLDEQDEWSPNSYEFVIRFESRSLSSLDSAQLLDTILDEDRSE